MKILMLTGSFRVGGAQRQMLELTRRLSPDRFAVSVLALNREGPLEADFSAAGLTASTLGRGIRYLTLRRRLRQERPQVLHCWGDSANLWGTLCCGRGTAMIMSWRNLGQRMVSYRRLVERLAVRRAAALVANSQAVARCLTERGLAAASVRVIPNGVDTKRFRPPSEDERQRARTSQGLAGAGPVVACLARTDPVKNLALFVDIAARVSEEFVGTHFVVIGGSANRVERAEADRVAALAERRGLGERFQLLGLTSEVPTALASADLVMQTSREEGLPNGLIEAAACGLPAIASDVGGSSEVIQDGQTGLLFPSGDAAAGAARLREMLADPDKRAIMGNAALRRARELFRMDRMVADYEELYLELCGEQP